MTDCEIVVIGGGTMGTAAAWQLAERGHEVVLLEQFGHGHTRGASHGATRNFNMAYAEHDYLTLAAEARTLWSDLEERTGIRVLDLVGLVNHGDPDQLGRVASAVAEQGLAYEWVPAAEAEDRWRGMRFDTPVLHLPGSGRARAADALRAMRQAASAAGADVQFEQPVTALRVEGDNRAVVHTPTQTLRARRVVVTAGAWTQPLLGGHVSLPPLHVSEEQPSHFAIADDDAAWPSFNHLRAPGLERDAYWPAQIYGMETPGEGLKVGWHKAGERADPNARTGRDDERLLALLRRYASEWLPGVDPEQAVPVHCTYTSTPNEDFILDAAGPLVVGAGFSGHGFKFSPAIGRVLADLARGIRPAQRFRQLR